MAEKRPIQDLMGVTMEKMREMVDVQTIIGDPIVVSDKVTIVPVSKVSYGFASGGSDLPVKTNPKDLFGGGAGAGVSIQPVAFLVVQEDGVRLLQMDEGSDALSSAIRSVPEVVDRLGSMFKKGDKKNDKKKDKKKKDKSNGGIAKKTKETMSELKKVTWPTFGEVCKKTGIVIAFVLIFCLFLFGINTLLGWLVGLLVG